MAIYCSRCGSFNAGQAQACLTCMAPLSKGQSAPEDTRCATHASEAPLGRCMSCGKTICYECGSLVDARILCMTCSTSAVTTTGTSEAAPAKKRGFGRKK